MLPELDGKEIDNPEVVCYSAHPKNKWSKNQGLPLHLAVGTRPNDQEVHCLLPPRT